MRFTSTIFDLIQKRSTSNAIIRRIAENIQSFSGDLGNHVRIYAKMFFESENPVSIFITLELSSGTRSGPTAGANSSEALIVSITFLSAPNYFAMVATEIEDLHTTIAGEAAWIETIISNCSKERHRDFAVGTRKSFGGTSLD